MKRVVRSRRLNQEVESTRENIDTRDEATGRKLKEGLDYDELYGLRER